MFGAAIIGGSEFVAENYIAKGQNTLYLQKFNVLPKNTDSLYTHQYMQNILAAQNEGTDLKDRYGSLVNSSFVFTIPLYNNMPSVACPRPSNTDTIRYSGNNAYINSNEVRLRSAPSINGGIIKYLNINTQVIILEEATQISGDGYYWDRIVTKDDEIKGYVARNYLTKN